MAEGDTGSGKGELGMAEGDSGSGKDELGAGEGEIEFGNKSSEEPITITADRSHDTLASSLIKNY